MFQNVSCLPEAHFQNLKFDFVVLLRKKLKYFQNLRDCKGKCETDTSYFSLIATLFENGVVSCLLNGPWKTYSTMKSWR